MQHAPLRPKWHVFSLQEDVQHCSQALCKLGKGCDMYHPLTASRKVEDERAVCCGSEAEVMPKAFAQQEHDIPAP
eukprot:365333-Chlamydomonas_euryale.AAC.14